ncbi:MAG: PD-(D/E)XK nuclease family protein [Planctomycetes bacterium]|nr:PD-(D/E)XK nuclease family protein [Planctomycetota bacterium]
MPRKSSLYDPKSKEPFKFSRTKLENFMSCPRCFYLDRRLGVKQPDGPPFTLNTAVDGLLKNEFDIYRKDAKAHPLMEKYGIKAIPFRHEDMDDWRNNFKGIQHHHAKTNFLVFGAIDDVWANDGGELSIVDYKSTAKKGELSLNEEWHAGWKRQMEIYQWLFRKNGFKVADTGYFVYCNGQKEKEAFNCRLEFVIEIHSYKGDDGWVEKELIKAKECLDGDKIPDYTEDCDFCQYHKSLLNIK